MRNERGFTVIELSVVIAIFLVMVIALTPFVNFARARAHRIECAEHLMKISLGLHKYAKEHRGGFPAKLSGLYPKYLNDEKVFDCPEGKTAGTGLNPDYIYMAGLKNVPSKEIIAQDLDGNHRGKHKNVLRVDGSVDWI